MRRIPDVHESDALVQYGRRDASSMHTRTRRVLGTAHQKSRVSVDARKSGRDIVNLAGVAVVDTQEEEQRATRTCFSRRKEITEASVAGVRRAGERTARRPVPTGQTATRRGWQSKAGLPPARIPEATARIPAATAPASGRTATLPRTVGGVYSSNCAVQSDGSLPRFVHLLCDWGRLLTKNFL